MKRILKIIGIILMISILMGVFISCIELKDCTHCDGTGKAHLTILSASNCTASHAEYCYSDYPNCGRCNGTGKAAW